MKMSRIDRVFKLYSFLQQFYFDVIDLDLFPYGKFIAIYTINKKEKDWKIKLYIDHDFDLIDDEVDNLAAINILKDFGHKCLENDFELIDITPDKGNMRADWLNKIMRQNNKYETDIQISDKIGVFSFVVPFDLYNLLKSLKKKIFTPTQHQLEIYALKYGLEIDMNSFIKEKNSGHPLKKIELDTLLSKINRKYINFFE